MTIDLGPKIRHDRGDVKGSYNNLGHLTKMTGELHGADVDCKSSFTKGSTPSLVSTHDKFGAKSRQYADVGKAMRKAYWKYDAVNAYAFTLRHLFTTDDLHSLIDWYEHMLGAEELRARELSTENSKLKRRS